jgi:DNA-binding MarR family transcriptional regulator
VASALRAEVTTSVLDSLELTFPRYICMRVLSKYGDRSNAELARNTGVSPQAMNMVLRGLEERGLVSRPASVASGRSLPATLTRRGRELLARSDSGVKAAEQRLLGSLTETQQRKFRRILTALGSPG